MTDKNPPATAPGPDSSAYEFEEFAAAIGVPYVRTGEVGGVDGHVTVCHDAVHTRRVRVGLSRTTTRGAQWMRVDLSAAQTAELVAVLLHGLDRVQRHQNEGGPTAVQPCFYEVGVCACDRRSTCRAPKDKP